MGEWILFFNGLGRFLSGYSPLPGQRLNVIVSVPILNYASLVAASGVICKKFEDRTTPVERLDEWRDKGGQSVVFPLPKNYRDDDSPNRIKRALLRKEGVIDDVGVNPLTQSPILRIKYLEQQGGKVERDYTSFLPPEFLPLVSEIEREARIDSIMRGSKIAEDLEGLESFLGLKGAIEMIGSKHKICCIFDSRARVYREASHDFSVARLTSSSTEKSVLMRDAVRFRGDGREAVRETSSCKVVSEIEPDWPLAIFSGALRFLRFWDDCESPVRIGIISSMESSYGDAVEFANLQFRRRSSGPEFVPPRELMSLMPSTVDAQFFYSA